MRSLDTTSHISRLLEGVSRHVLSGGLTSRPRDPAAVSYKGAPLLTSRNSKASSTVDSTISKGRSSKVGSKSTLSATAGEIKRSISPILSQPRGSRGTQPDGRQKRPAAKKQPLKPTAVGSVLRSDARRVEDQIKRLTECLSTRVAKSERAPSETQLPAEEEPKEFSKRPVPAEHKDEQKAKETAAVVKVQHWYRRLRAIRALGKRIQDRQADIIAEKGNGGKPVDTGVQTDPEQKIVEALCNADPDTLAFIEAMYRGYETYKKLAAGKGESSS